VRGERGERREERGERRREKGGGVRTRKESLQAVLRPLKRWSD